MLTMKGLRLLLLVLALALPTVGQAPTPLHAQDTPPILFFAQDQSFSAILPQGWDANGDANGLIVANSAKLIRTLEITESGQRLILIQAIAYTDFDLYGLPEDASALAFAEAAVTSLARSDGSTLYGTPETTDDGLIRASFAGDSVEGRIMVKDHLAPGVIGYVTMTAAKGEFAEDVEAEMLTILRGVHYGLPLDTAYVSVDGLFSTHYPDNWVISDFGAAVMGIYDSQTTLNHARAEQAIVEGESRLGLIGFDRERVPPVRTPITLKEFAVQAAAEVTSTSEHEPILGTPVWLENVALVGGGLAFVPIMTNVSMGGLLLANDSGAVFAVVFTAARDEGDHLFGTALAIANSTIYTPAQ